MALTRFTPARCCCGVDPDDICPMCISGTMPATIDVQLSGWPIIRPVALIRPFLFGIGMVPPDEEVSIDLNDTYTLVTSGCAASTTQTLLSGTRRRDLRVEPPGPDVPWRFTLFMRHEWNLGETLRIGSITSALLPIDAGVKHLVSIIVSYIDGRLFFDVENTQSFLAVFFAVADNNPAATINCSRTEPSFNFWHANEGITGFAGAFATFRYLDWDGTDDFWGADVGGSGVAVV